MLLWALCFQVIWKNISAAFWSEGRQSNGWLHKSTGVHDTNLTDVKFSFHSNRRLAILNRYFYSANWWSPKIILGNSGYCNLQTGLAKLVNEVLRGWRQDERLCLLPGQSSSINPDYPVLFLTCFNLLLRVKWCMIAVLSQKSSKKKKKGGKKRIPYRSLYLAFKNEFL